MLECFHETDIRSLPSITVANQEEGNHAEEIFVTVSTHINPAGCILPTANGPMGGQHHNTVRRWVG